VESLPDLVSVLSDSRQYNKDKPNKYWVDFFILANSTSYAILHMDVYQGKNQANINIDKQATSLPTTHKAVINAVFHTRLGNDTEEGYQCLSMDNQYQCPELAVLLCDRCKILSTGTVRKN
jgi:hypothetical protein